MTNPLWSGAVAVGPAAARPLTGQAPENTFQFYLASDTGQLSLWDRASWRNIDSGVQAAPVAKTGSATLTADEVQNGIVTVTSSTAVALTLPTGALMDAGFQAGAAKVNQSFDWAVINLGSASGAITMTAATGHTIVGAAGVPINTSARFLTRKTAANTFVTYRL